MLDTQKFHADDSGFYIDDFKLKGVKNISIDAEESSATLTMHIPSSEIDFSDLQLSIYGFALRGVLFFSISSDVRELPFKMLEFRVKMSIQANEETQKEHETQWLKERSKYREKWLDEPNANNEQALATKITQA